MNRVKMLPTLEMMGPEESGIKRVIEAYTRYLPEYGWRAVGKEDSYDIQSVHAGVLPGHVAHLHGLYWTGDYLASNWEWRSNRDIAESVRASIHITVPSSWVAETIKRDLHVAPFVLGHGIEWEQWQAGPGPDGMTYILWNKNRTGDVCDPTPVYQLAQRFPDERFVSTFAPIEARGMGNVLVTGLMPHEDMKATVQGCGIYLSTTKETFGIGVLEAMACGKPVLGYQEGGICDLIQHGVNGYLAQPGNVNDLADGLNYCLQYRDTLGENGRELAREFSWLKAVGRVAAVYDIANHKPAPSVAVIIPTYNYKDKVERAILSAANQTFKPARIVIVDDGSTDGTFEMLQDKRQVWYSEYPDIDFAVIRQNNSGVAVARNNGISHALTKYICCLDADDAIEPGFLEACVDGLEADPSVGIAYTGLYMIDANGRGQMSPWPGPYNFDAQLQRRNQVPTCCVFRRVMWERAGGYRQRYAPTGAGSEDAEFWLRAGALGFKGKQVTEAGLFVYSVGTGRVSGNREYHEADWLAFHPWIKDEKHPYASVATPRHFSHPVYAYDQPEVSVIIPVGPGHKHLIGNAVDGMEAQTFRKWELIVVDDTGNPDEPWIFDGNPEILRSWPFIRIVQTKGKEGAGAARNLGASVACAPLLLFLDADDWLLPEALEKLIMGWNISGQIVYSDYIAKCYLSQEEANRAMDQQRLKSYDPNTQEAVIVNHTLDYDCDLAVAQPGDDRLYQWCLITALVPKAWHDEIGGFDPNMPAWEDWEYFIDLARAGKCFTRLPEPLMIYRFATGNRRAFAEPESLDGRQNARKLLKYMTEKRKAADSKMCGCHGNSVAQPQVIMQARPAYGAAPSRSQGATSMLNHPGNFSDNDFVEVLYQPGVDGDHGVVGLATRINYNRHRQGDVFLVHRDDIAADPDHYVPVQKVQPVPAAPPAPTPAPTMITPKKEQQPPPKARRMRMADEPTISTAVIVDLQELPGVSPEVEEQLRDAGLNTLNDILAAGADGLMELGLSKTKSATIIKAINKRMGNE